VLFALGAIATLAVTPLAAGLALRPAPVCDPGGDARLLVAALGNVRHLVAFAALTVLAAAAFGGRRAAAAIGLMLLLTAGVEVEQAIFADGHCRLRDLLPDAAAIAVGLALAALLSGLWRHLRAAPAGR
jgi:hypothetical protein